MQIRFPVLDFDTIATILADALSLPEHDSEATNNDSDNSTNSNNNNNNQSSSSTVHGRDHDEHTGGNTCGDTGFLSPTPIAPPSATPELPGIGIFSTAFARDFNATTRQVLLGAAAAPTASSNNNTHGTSGNVARNTAFASSFGAMRSATGELRALAASGRSVGWFLRLASTAVSLLEEGDRGVTKVAWIRAGEMMAPDPHAQALRSLSVTQVKERGGCRGAAGGGGWGAASRGTYGNTVCTVCVYFKSNFL